MSAVTVSPRDSQKGGQLWRPMMRVIAIKNRWTIVAVGALSMAVLIVILVERAGLGGLYSSYLSNRCNTIRPGDGCGGLSNMFQAKRTVFSAVELLMRAIPVVIAVFVGAPLLSREFENNAYRFTWTQGMGRARYANSAIVLVGCFVGILSLVLGFSFAWYAHPFEVAGHASMWAPGVFDEAGPVYALWTLLLYVIGVLIGLIARRIVAAMAWAVALTAGVIIGWTSAGLGWALGLSPQVTTSVSPEGIGLGRLDAAALPDSALHGSWLIQAWITNARHEVLNPLATSRVQARLDSTPHGFVDHPIQWLEHHGFHYLVTFQGPDRFGYFHGGMAVALVILTGLGLLGASRLVRREPA